MTEDRDPKARLCIIGEPRVPPDEGIRKVTCSLISEFAHRKLAMLVISPQKPAIAVPWCPLPSRRNFVHPALGRYLSSFNPQAVLYIPRASATLSSFIRAMLLRSYARKARIIMLSLQPRPLPALSKIALRAMAPDHVFVQSASALAILQRLNCPASFLPSGVDLQRFIPAGIELHQALRAQYGLDGRPVLLHVGHIKRNRGLQTLLETRKRLPQIQIVVISSTASIQDREMLGRLQGEGILVLTRYIERIEEIYQLADAYVFPVSTPTGSIGVPLSVLEAMACNLPVVAYPFGGLPTMFREGNGLWFAKREEFATKIQAALDSTTCNTREMVKPYSWERMADVLLQEMQIGARQK